MTFETDYLLRGRLKVAFCQAGSFEQGRSVLQVERVETFENRPYTGASTSRACGSRAMLITETPRSSSSSRNPRQHDESQCELFLDLVLRFAIVVLLCSCLILRWKVDAQSCSATNHRSAHIRGTCRLALSFSASR